MKRDVWIKLFKSHCCSFYGSHFWKFNSSGFDKIYKIWNIAIRILLYLPYNTHTLFKLRINMIFTYFHIALYSWYCVILFVYYCILFVYYCILFVYNCILFEYYCILIVYYCILFVYYCILIVYYCILFCVLLYTFCVLLYTFCVQLYTFCVLLYTFYVLLYTFYVLLFTFCVLLYTYCVLLYTIVSIKTKRYILSSRIANKWTINIRKINVGYTLNPIWSQSI